jgi:hypothetical protein
MSYPKPGPNKKNKKKMPKPPVEKHCRSCNIPTGTERWCHAESKLIKFKSGGGIMGGRIPHDKTAWLCFDCDIKHSHALPKNATQKQLESHAEEWKELIKLSHK